MKLRVNTLLVQSCFAPELTYIGEGRAFFPFEHESYKMLYRARVFIGGRRIYDFVMNISFVDRPTKESLRYADTLPYCIT